MVFYHAYIVNKIICNVTNKKLCIKWIDIGTKILSVLEKSLTYIILLVFVVLSVWAYKTKKDDVNAIAWDQAELSTHWVSSGIQSSVWLLSCALVVLLRLSFHIFERN